MKEVLFGILAIIIIFFAAFAWNDANSNAVYAGVCSAESVPDCAEKSVRSPCALNGEMGECIPLYKPKSCLCVSNP